MARGYVATAAVEAGNPSSGREGGKVPTPTTASFSRTARFTVQWQHDGDLNVVDNPLLRGESPLLAASGDVVVSLHRAADRAAATFLAKAGRTYQRQFESLSAAERAKVVFPEVKVTVRVRCRVDVAAKKIVSGQAEAKGRVTDLPGRRRDVSASTSVSRVGVEVYPLVVSTNPGRLEIEGDPAPGCVFYWLHCQCRFPCCGGIVQDLYSGKCYSQKCAWSTLWFGCGCHRDKLVNCPQMSG
jgi:hypothetical protein